MIRTRGGDGARPPTRPDLLARIEALGVRDKVVLERAGLAPAFLSKARGGAGTDPKAGASWSKLEVALAELEREKARAGGGAAARAASSPQKGRRSRPLSALGPTREAPASLAAVSAPAVAGLAPGGEGANSSAVPPELQELVKAIQGSTTPEALSGLQRRVMELAAIGPTRGGISSDVARVLIQAVSEQRQLLRSQREAEEKARGDEPLTIKILYVDSWRERTASGGKGGGE